MRSISEANQLSYDSFIETFGNVKKQQQDKTDDIHANNRSPAIPRINITEETKTQIKSVKDEDVKNNNAGERKRRIGITPISHANDFNSINNQPQSGKMTPSSDSKPNRLRKISVGALSSIGGAMQAAVASRWNKTNSNSANPPDHLPSNELKPERKDSWFSSISPSFARKSRSNSKGSLSEEESNNDVETSYKVTQTKTNPDPFSVPATHLNTAAHNGYLERRNKKKHWERFWCVLQDSCLHCYHTPQSETASDIMLIRGYGVIADITNLNRSRFIFRLRRQGVPTLHFSSDNHRDFLLWVGTLERETRSGTKFSSKSRSFSEELSSSPPSERCAPTALRKHRASLPNLRITDLFGQRGLECVGSPDKLDDGLLKMQKRKLLKEIAVQQQHLLEEQKLLEKLPSILEQQHPDTVVIDSLQGLSRREILENYEKEKNGEEQRDTKHVTFLKRRRNSCCIKMTQISKDLSPLNCQGSNADLAKFASMERKLKKMQQELNAIDKELEEEKETKQQNLERLEKQRDLQLLIVEQRDAMDILRRNHAKGAAPAMHRRYSYDISSLSSATRSYDALTSIDEMSTVSDEMTTSSTTSSLSDATGILTSRDHLSSSNHDVEQAIDTRPILLIRSGSDSFVKSRPLESAVEPDKEYFTNNEGKNSFEPPKDFTSAFHRSNSIPSPSQERRSSREEFDELASRESTLKSSSAYTIRDEVDSSILAKIEDFEMFAKLKLEQSRKP